MKQLVKGLLGVLILVLTVNTIFAQTWYQKKKQFVPFIVGAAAMGGVDVLKDIKSWKGERIWSAVGGGINNKNTSIGAFATSYEWQNFKDIYAGISLQRRLFYIGRFEPWVGLAYSIPLEGHPEFKFQPSIRGKVQLNKALAVSLGYEQVLDKKQNFNLTSNRAVELALSFSIHGNPHVDYK